MIVEIVITIIICSKGNRCHLITITISNLILMKIFSERSRMCTVDHNSASSFSSQSFPERSSMCTVDLGGNIFFTPLSHLPLTVSKLVSAFVCVRFVKVKFFKKNVLNIYFTHLFHLPLTVSNLFILNIFFIKCSLSCHKY